MSIDLLGTAWALAARGIVVGLVLVIVAAGAGIAGYIEAIRAHANDPDWWTDDTDYLTARQGVRG